MTKNYGLRTKYEAKTRELFEVFLEHDWSTYNIIVYKVLKAMWHATLPIERIERIGSAIINADIDMDNLKSAVDALVKAKVLRNRKIDGAVHFEVNY